MTQKRKRRTKAEIEASKLSTYEVVIDENVSGVEKISLGLGDTLEKVFEATGIASVVKFIAGDDCGCTERKDKLNQIFPYHKPNCLVEAEYNYLSDFFNTNTNMVTGETQKRLLEIYNRIFNQKKQPTSCGSCLRDVVNQLKRVHNTY